MADPGASRGRLWWKEGAVYQINPASFRDSSGDGLGDIPGIISKMHYLNNLGIDIVQVTPMCGSSSKDMTSSSMLD